MKKADGYNPDSEGVEGMTDKQYLDHLRDLLEIAKGCNSLQEFVVKLETKIETYGK